MFGMISGVFLIALIVFLLIASRQPEEFRITRSAVMAAPAATVFEQVNDLHKWQAWSPWARMDPNAKNSFDGPASGVGAVMSWEGNAKVGKGRSTITESRAGELVRLRLDFLKPMKATNIAEFMFTPAEGGTLVNWSMTGRNQFLGKVMSLVFNCEKIVGGQFDQGLVNLKSIVEHKG